MKVLILIVLTIIFGCAIAAVITQDTNRPPATTKKVAAQKRPYAIDEFAGLVKACGNPAIVREKDAAAYGGPHAVEKDVKYANLEFMFLRNDDEPLWTMTGAFYRTKDDTITRAQATKAMPCVKRFTTSDPFFDPA